MILSRCPACQTVFRVRPEQLRTHNGSVRCGHCQAVFNALEHLIEEPAGPPTPAAPAPAERPAAPRADPPARTATEPPRPATPPEDTASPGGTKPSGVFVLEEKPREAKGEDPARALRLDAPLPFPGPARTPQSAAPEPAARDRRPSTFDDLANRLEFGLPDSFLTPSEPVARPAAPPRETPATDARRREPEERPAAESPPKAGEPLEFFDLPDLDLPHAEPTLQPLDPWGVTPDHGAMTEPGPGPAYEPEPTIAPEPTITPEPALAPEPAPRPVVADDDLEEPRTPYISDDVPLHEHLDAAYGRPPPSAGRRWLWGLGIGVLLGALAVQAAYVFRDEITREWPALRPAFVAVCEQLGCEMPLPRIAGAISIESSDLQSDPAEDGRFVLNALVRNRALHAQALPHLELTLTDARDRPLVRRVFTPAEWVPHGELERGFLPAEELATRLTFTAPGVNASGYRVYVFYP